MPSLIDGDDHMNALRVRSQQIEANNPANIIYDGSSDEDYCFNGKKLIAAVERDDTEAWRRLGFGNDLSEMQLDINGRRDSVAAEKIKSLSQKQTQTETRDGQHLGVPEQEMPSFPPPTIATRTLQRLRKQYNNRIVATARTFAAEARMTQVEHANLEYEQAFEQNMLEMEFGPSCSCNRYYWHHELHPMGTVMRYRQGKRG